MSCFEFKKFTIRQENTAMKVGTDGVLLGAWADISQASTILDIGTGTGLIALMSAQRNKDALIDAVEVNEDAYKQAVENIANSPWQKQIKVYFTSIFNYTAHTLYDSILCNPPFFVNSTKAPDNARNEARHCTDFSHVQLLETSSKLLHPHGKLSLILPYEEGNKLLSLTDEYHFFIHRITTVYPTLTSSTPKRLLIELSLQESIKNTDSIVIEHARHIYSPEYKKLTREFYLYF